MSVLGNKSKENVLYAVILLLSTTQFFHALWVNLLSYRNRYKKDQLLAFLAIVP